MSPSFVSPTLQLLTTHNCELCERAMDELLSMPELRGVALTVSDIAYDDDLLNRYGERIPVLRVGVIEFDWPLDKNALKAALRSPSQS